MKLLEDLKLINEEKLISFHVPGHKKSPIFTSYLKGLDGLLDVDTTEIPGTDDLHDPESCIRDLQESISDMFNTKATYLLTGGTTSGIYAMIMAVTKPGDTIIVARDCHRAVYDGILLGHLNAVYVEPVFCDGLPLGIRPNDLDKIVKEHPNAKAVVLTYPNYYGIGTDMQAIEEIVHKHSMFLLVDEAHGAHLGLSEQVMKSSLNYGADIVVHSSHKSLAALTQSSVLHLNSDKVDEKKLEQMLKLHQSSSPSYILMTSLDICYDIYMNRGKDLMKSLLQSIEVFKEKHPYFIDQNDLPKGYSLDPTKLTLDGKKANIDPRDLEIKLREEGIQLEFSNENYGVFVTSIMNESRDFEYLAKTMEMLKFKCYSGIDNVDKSFLSKKKLSISDAYYHQKKNIKLCDSENTISTEYIIPYPPGIPIIIPGELIDKETLVLIKDMLINKQKIIGIKDFDTATIEVVNSEEDK